MELKMPVKYLKKENFFNKPKAMNFVGIDKVTNNFGKEVFEIELLEDGEIYQLQCNLIHLKNIMQKWGFDTTKWQGAIEVNSIIFKVDSEGTKYTWELKAL